MTPINPGKRRRAASRASSLLLVIWAIMMMSFAVMSLVEFLDRGLDRDIESAKRFRARMLAESGLVLARHPAVRPGDPLLVQQVSSTGAYHVRVTSEGARIAVNRLGDSEAHHEILRRHLENVGVEPEEARALIEALADWIDGDDEPRDYGAEEGVYTALGWPEFPLNRAFRALDEMLLVRGMPEIERRFPEWRDWFTLHGDGSVDLNEAPSWLVRAVFDVTEDLARTLVEFRFGRDGIPETEDDVRFTALEEAFELLDLDDESQAETTPLLTLDHPVKRRSSRARVGGETFTLVEIAGPGVSIRVEEGGRASAAPAPPGGD